jgi:hypothetical protein
MCRRLHARVTQTTLCHIYTVYKSGFYVHEFPKLVVSVMAQILELKELVTHRGPRRGRGLIPPMSHEFALIENFAHNATSKVYRLISSNDRPHFNVK